MPTLYIMCGVAFSGKSTLARKLAEYTGSKIIAFDELWTERSKEKPVPKGSKGWRYIREIGQEAVLKSLKDGRSVVYDDTNVLLEHRQELRDIAKEARAKSVVVYLDTPLSVVRERETRNKSTAKRHEVEPENFQTVLEQLEPPRKDENVVVFKPEMNMEEWLKDLDNKF